SWDNTIRVWGAHSGISVAGPFEGRTSPVFSVAFSPDGTRIVSGSGDKTIRVWDAHSGLLVAGPFEGHTDSVSSVVFSPDGTRIASGSGDQTVRVWTATHSHASKPGHFNDWSMDKIGSITTPQGQLLLCVPVDLWTGVVSPQSPVCIYAKGVLRLDFDAAHRAYSGSDNVIDAACRDIAMASGGASNISFVAVAIDATASRLGALEFATDKPSICIATQVTIT
ncbi:WD40 repeat-like protein, partial [Ceratobasidium sp. AG-I]